MQKMSHKEQHNRHTVTSATPQTVQNKQSSHFTFSIWSLMTYNVEFYHYISLFCYGWLEKDDKS